MAEKRRQRALVLGAGGHAASAWEIGLAAGLEESGVSLKDADLFVGTSAGARIAVQLAGSTAVEELVRLQAEAKGAFAEEVQQVDWRQWRDAVLKAREGGGDTREILRRVGAMANKVEIDKTKDAERRAFVASQLTMRSWPVKRVLICAVNAETGERQVFDKSDGVNVLDAAMASGAVAGVWPAVQIEGQPYIDGGFYSIENADLAEGYERVLVVALRAARPPMSVVQLDGAVNALRAGGARVEVVHPDKATELVIAKAGGLLNPAVRGPAIKTGRAQGRQIAEGLRTFWNE